jgi:lipopolysaccharide transport system permease protein
MRQASSTAAPSREEPQAGGGQAPRRPKTIIRPRPGWHAVSLGEVWKYRDLLWFLSLREIQVRYRQTAFGAAWALVQPLFNMALFTLFFGRLAGLDERIPREVPYSVYTLCALLPWQLFASSVTLASASLVVNRGLITKVYFPRVLVPASCLLCGLLDFAVSLVLLVLMMAWYGLAPGWGVLALPLYLLLAAAAALAVGLWLSALNALYHDVQHTLGFLTQAWLFATPVAYPSSIVPRGWHVVLGLNPMASVADGFRWCLLGTPAPDLPMLLTSVLVVAALLGGSLFFFRRMEKVFADVV